MTARLATAAFLMFCSASHNVAGKDDVYVRGLEYLRSLPKTERFYVWPTVIRPFEVIGTRRDEVSRLLESYVDRTKGMFLLTDVFGTPMISVLLYNRSEVNPYKEFIEQSRMSNVYKQAIAGLDLSYDGCAFASMISRDTWAAGGVVFIDAARLPDAGERAYCLQAGLDYINGFPAATERTTHRDLPNPDVREVVLAAINRCSEEGASESDERSRDGLTPLPPMSCVMTKLKENKDGTLHSVEDDSAAHKN